MRKNVLSQEGIEFLKDPVMNVALTVIAASVGVTPEEYLLRFEEVLEENPDILINTVEA